MIWVIEGLDGTGKTTLARELSHVLNAPVLKTGAEDSHNDYIDDMIVARTIGACRPDRHIILDRTIFSGLSYGPVGPIRANMLLREWLAGINGIPVIVIHLIASETARMSRDYRGTKGTLDCTLDADIAAWVSGLQKEGYDIKYVVYDTTHLLAGHIIESLSNVIARR